MKILKIRGCNLASIVNNFDIDFSDPRFVTSGVFAITGPTGSGKSTLLDAINLAFFGETPRFQSAKTETVNDLNGIKAVSITDVANIMTLGQKSCYAEVEFLNNNSERCVTKWMATVNAKGTSYKKNVYFENFETHEICDKVTSKADAIFRAIGLNFAQFNQVVLLPQGDFSNFLKADPVDRVNLLEQITGLTIYKDISAKVNELKKSVTLKINDLNTILSSLSLLSEDEKKSQEKLLASHLGDYDLTKKEIENIKSVEDVTLSLKKSTQELEKRNLELVEISKNSQEIEDVRKIWQDYTYFMPYRSMYQRIIDKKLYLAKIELELSQLNNDLEKCKEIERFNFDTKNKNEIKLEKIKTDYKKNTDDIIVASTLDAKIVDANFNFTKAKQDFDELNKKYLVVLNNKAQCFKILEEEKIKKQQNEIKRNNLSIFGKLANSWKYIYEKLNKFVEYQVESANLKSQRESKVEKYNFLLQQENSLKNSLNQKEQELESCNRDYNQAQNTIQKSEKLQISKRLEELREHSKLCDDFVNVAASIPDDIKELNKLSVDESSANSSIEQLSIDLESMQNSYKSCSNEIDNIEKDIRKNVVLNALNESRKELEEGKPCPLCGAVHHPYLEHMPSTNSVNDLEKLLNEQKLKKDELSNNINEKLALRERTLSNVENFRKNSKKISLDVESKIFKSSKLLKKLGFDEITVKSADIWQNNLQAIVGLKNEDLKAIEQSRSEYNLMIEAQTSKDQCIDKIKKLTIEVDELRKLLITNNQSKNDCNVAAVDDAINNFLLLSEQLEKDINNDIGEGLDWKNVVINQSVLNDFNAKVLANIDTYTRLELDLSKNDADIIRYNFELNNLCAQLDQDVSNLKLSDKNRQEKESVLDELKNEREHLLGGASVEAYKAMIENELTDAEQNFNSSLKLHNNSVEKLTTTEKILSLKQETENECKSDLTLAQQEYENLATNVLHANTGYLEKIFTLSPANIDSYKEKIETHDTSLKKAQDNIVSAEAVVTSYHKDLIHILNTFDSDAIDGECVKIEHINETKIKLNELKQSIENIQFKLSTNEENIKKSADIVLEIDKIKRCNRSLFELDELLGSSSGANNFSRFAQGITFDLLLAGANRYLRQLMPRYELKRVIGNSKRHNLLVMVIDHDNADNERASSSISGGETFVVSLSLALALSDITNKTSKMESLFIDEGFGTLDPDNLDMVMTVLERLNKNGSTVGIITHMEGVASRVQTQICLERISDDPAHSKVVIYPK